MGLITGIVSGGFSVLTGIGKMVSAGDIGREKKKLLESRANYNRQQIEKAYAENYAKNMSQYANSLSSILNDKDTGLSNINVASTNIGDADIQGSSFRTTALAQLNNEFNTSMNLLNDNLMNERLTLAQEKNNQIMETNISLFQAKQAVNAQTDAMKAEGFADVVNGIVGMADSVITGQSTDKKAINQDEKAVQDLNENVGKLKNPYSTDTPKFEALTKNVKSGSSQFKSSFGIGDWQEYQKNKYGFSY